MTRPPYHRVNPSRPRSGRVPRQRSVPPPRSTGGKASAGGACLVAVIAGTLTVGAALILTPLAARAATHELVPAADRTHYGDVLAPAVAVALFALYLAVSLLVARRGSRRPVPAELPSPGEAPAAVGPPAAAGAGGTS